MSINPCYVFDGANNALAAKKRKRAARHDWNGVNSVFCKVGNTKKGFAALVIKKGR
ncbi:MAG: hypothetical protein ACI8U1_002059 [Rheinheimera aquimaris]|jgi:hypothetical protein|tara:strand:- start:124 stop:291 length:168 start_codon:yes stop_codon:yes gene_type:complete